MAAAAAGSAVAFNPAILDAVGTPQDIARNEDFWMNVQQAFTVDRSIVNLNSGGVSPSPAVVQTAMKRHLDFSNAGPAHNMWGVLEPQVETVRKALAGMFGCDSEEIAITRNSSEALQICQFGLDLKAGDEVLTTDQDYGRMLNTWKQRERREKIVLKTFPIPVPSEEPEKIVALFEQNITHKTRVILMCHMINLTGQILPVKKVVQMARTKGIPVIVDGAHSFAHFPFTQADLDCDYFATSLHKWTFAPHGTGMLYVRQDKIADLWPMMAASEEQKNDIRKFEEIGTHPAANHNAVAEAVAFNQAIGLDRKAERMRYLRDRWVKRLQPNVKLFSSLKPEFSCGIATFGIEGMDHAKLRDFLWAKHKIIVVHIKHKDIDGIRVSPSIWNTLQEVDRFADAVEDVLKKGLPEK
jgi:selenocysteine lyase/cysteine desulfurase